MGRSRETLAWQKDLITAVLGSLGEDSWVSHGKQDDPRGYDRPFVLPGHGESLGVQRRPRYEAEHCAMIEDIVDRAHPQVRWYLGRALAQLSERDQEILRQRIKFGRSCAVIKRGLRLGTRFAVDQRVDYLLGELARALWDEAGLPLVPRANSPREAETLPGAVATR